jgi:uncharacterized membrane-anchored protein
MNSHQRRNQRRKIAKLTKDEEEYLKDVENSLIKQNYSEDEISLIMAAFEFDSAIRRRIV